MFKSRIVHDLGLKDRPQFENFENVAQSSCSIRVPRYKHTLPYNK